MAMMIQQQNQEATLQKGDESILVVKRDLLFPANAHQGLLKDREGYYEKLVNGAMEFHPRSLMEEDVLYKQIIPYLVFHHQGRYFLMQRSDKGTEKRLRNRYTLGIGGHVRQEDLIGVSIADWARREFHEEVMYAGNVRSEFLGVLNDDSNPVGQVHLGFVYLFHGDSDAISVKSELKSGELKNVAECTQHYEQLEDWSKIVLKYLQSGR